MKRLYRDKSNEMIAGVCSGIADYLDVDPTIIRLVFVLFAFLGGGGLWIYLVLWIIMPEKPQTGTDVVEVIEKPAPAKAPVKKAPAAKSAAKTATAAKKPAAKKTTATKQTAGKKSTAAAKPESTEK